MQLTDAKIKALKPRDGRYLVSDGDGLSLDVLPSGVMSWLFRYRHGGKQERVTLGRYPSMTLKAARQARLERAASVAGGKSPAKEKKLARAGLTLNPTVEVFGERYYKEQILPNWKDPKSIRRYLDNEVYPALGRKQLNDVTALDVQALVYRKRDNGHVASAIQVRRVVKQIFDYALELQLVTLNPAAMVATRYIGRARKRSRVLCQRRFGCISARFTNRTSAGNSNWPYISSCSPCRANQNFCWRGGTM